MKTASINFGLLLLRVGFSVGLMTHGYGKFMKVIQGNFEFGDPIFDMCTLFEVNVAQHFVSLTIHFQSA